MGIWVTYVNAVDDVSSASSATRNTQQTTTFQMNILYNFPRQLQATEKLTVP